MHPIRIPVGNVDFVGMDPWPTIVGMSPKELVLEEIVSMNASVVTVIQKICILEAMPMFRQVDSYSLALSLLLLAFCSCIIIREHPHGTNCWSPRRVPAGIIRESDVSRSRYI